MDEVKQVTSVKAFVDAITTMRSEYPVDNAQQWFFRGQKNAGWDVCPNIFRGEDLTAEHLFIDRALRQNPIEFHDCKSSFEILTKLQHYGLGTRLLDVTLNPLVALYFATESSNEYIKNQNGQFSYTEHDGAVYYRFVSGCSLHDLQIKIALTIPFVEFGKSMSLETFCDHLKDNRIISELEYTRLSEDDFSQIIEMMQTNSFIVASNTNARLQQQRGAFLISPSINIKTDNRIGKSILSKAKTSLKGEFEGHFVIPSKKKAAIREELDFFNVNEATLFPEFEHQMRYIQGQFCNSVGTVEEYKRYVRTAQNTSAVTFEKKTPDVPKTISKAFPTISVEELDGFSCDVAKAIDTIDWHLKDSVISRLRRIIKKNIINLFPTADVESKTNEIVEALLK